MTAQFEFDMFAPDEEVNEGLVKSVPDLRCVSDFISENEENGLRRAIEAEPWLDDLKRQVQHYGYKYDYKARIIDESFKIGPLPEWSILVTKRLMENNIIGFIPDQLIVNKYEPPQGIAMHVDCEPCFTDTIISLSLGSDIVMDFCANDSPKETTSVLLKRRSLVVLSGESRYTHQHGIAKRKNDDFNGTKRPRGTRISLTFRKVILG